MQYLSSIFIIWMLFFSIINGQEKQLSTPIEILDTCIYLNGENDFYNAGSYDVDSCFSFSFWFNSDDLLSQNKALLNIDEEYWIKTTTHRELQISQPNKGIGNTSGLEISQHIWYHLSLVVNYPQAHLYINGHLTSSFTFNKRKPPCRKVSFIFGKNSWREFYKGQIAQFKFFEHCITPKAIKTIYKKELIRYHISDNTLAYLAMDNNTVNGSIPNRPIFSNIKFVKDKERGKVAQFDSLSYIDLGDVEMDNVVTLSAWVKPSTHKRLALISSGQAFAYRINYHNNFLFTIPQVLDIYTKDRIIKRNEWQHVVVTYHEKKKVCFYVNGKKVEEVIVDTSQKASKKIRIGNNLWNDNYIGFMDDVVIWNRILSDSEIQELSKMSSQKLSTIMPQQESNAHWLIWPITLIIGAISTFLVFRKKKKPHAAEQIERLPDPFKEKVEHVIQEKLTDSSFGVDQFAELMAMSKTTLYNRMKSQYGKSPKAFIREQRLMEASKQILSTSNNISEIIFSTGFESRAFFNKCFKAKYGMTPSMYRENNSTSIK